MKEQAVTYSVVAKQNPADKGAAPLYYAATQARGVLDFRTLANDAERMCSITTADILGVIQALETLIIGRLKNGEIVRLGSFGSLQISISSKGAPSYEEFKKSNITGAHYVFRPGNLLTEALKALKYEQVPTRYKKQHPKDKPAIKARSDLLRRIA